MENIDIGQYILFMVAFIFSLSVHEAAHAWTSNYFGDDLARSQGRISLSPVTHVDPIGTLLFPTLAFFTGAPLLGWARPTPVNPLRWRNRRVANFWVSIAGVLCNAAIAVIAGVAIRVLIAADVITPVEGNLNLFSPTFEYDLGVMMGVVQLLKAFFVMNVVLAVFNLLPIPPLDGSKILGSILPDSFAPLLEATDRFGFILLIAIVFTGVLSGMFSGVMSLAWNAILIGTGYYYG